MVSLGVYRVNRVMCVCVSLCVFVHAQATMQSLPLRILIKQIIVNYLNQITTPTSMIEKNKNKIND